MSALKALLSSRPVAYYPELARAVGGIAPALFFQQIVHWQGRNPNAWVFRTQEELEAELAMSAKVQAAARQHLVKRGLLEEKHDGMPRRLYYRPVWDNIESALQTCHREGQDLPDGQVQSSPSGDTTLKNRDESSNSRRDAKASPDVMENPFGFYCHLAKALDVIIAPEDREQTSKHFKDLIRLEKPAEAELKKAVSKMLEARASGFEMSPQKALGKVRGNNVVKFPHREPESAMTSTAGYRTFE